MRSFWNSRTIAALACGLAAGSLWSGAVSAQSFVDVGT
jgi:hypothetical protein